MSQLAEAGEFAPPAGMHPRKGPLHEPGNGPARAPARRQRSHSNPESVARREVVKLPALGRAFV
jgi:hypothetical protein